MNIYTCPNCGANSYEERYTESTAIYSPIRVLEGQYHFHDPNIHTTHCICLKCHHKFDAKEQEGKILDIIDKGEEIQIPTITNENITFNVEDSPITAMSEYVPMETKVSIATIDEEGNSLREKTELEIQVEELQKQVEMLEKKVNALWECNTHEAID